VARPDLVPEFARGLTNVDTLLPSATALARIATDFPAAVPGSSPALALARSELVSQRRYLGVASAVARMYGAIPTSEHLSILECWALDPALDPLLRIEAATAAARHGVERAAGFLRNPGFEGLRSALARYGLAQAQAAAGTLELALTTLEEAADLGFRADALLTRPDSSWAPCANDPRFAALSQSIRADRRCNWTESAAAVPRPDGSQGWSFAHGRSEGVAVRAGRAHLNPESRDQLILLAGAGAWLELEWTPPRSVSNPLHSLLLDVFYEVGTDLSLPDAGHPSLSLRILEGDRELLREEPVSLATRGGRHDLQRTIRRNGGEALGGPIRVRVEIEDSLTKLGIFELTLRPE
jgi:hypothetical protein